MKTFLLLLLSVAVARAELIHGKVELTGLKGSISAKSKLDPAGRSLTAGDSLREDEELTTPSDGTAELLFSNGVRVIVAPGSALRLGMFRQVKNAADAQPLPAGEKADDGSVVDLQLGSGRVTVVCPPLQERSLISVRTLQGRSDLSRNGIYDLSFERGVDGELVAQTTVLAGSLLFTPAGKGQSRSVKVEAGNRLLLTSESSRPARVALEKLKMDVSEVEAHLQVVPFDPATDPALPKVGQPVVAQAVTVSAGSSSGLSATEEAIQKVTQDVLDRQVQANPSPTGG